MSPLTYYSVNIEDGAFTIWNQHPDRLLGDPVAEVDWTGDDDIVTSVCDWFRHKGVNVAGPTCWAEAKISPGSHGDWWIEFRVEGSVG